MMEEGHARWLTHEEISQGVIVAIQQDPPIHIIGTLQPWEKATVITTNLRLTRWTKVFTYFHYQFVVDVYIIVRGVRFV